MPIEPIRYVPTGAMLEETGISGNDLFVLAPRLKAASDAVWADIQQWQRGTPQPPERMPLDAGFIELPERMLEEHRARGAASELAQIIATAERLRRQVDRVVVLGIGGSYMGARALMEACCHPYYNELSRTARGNRPSMYFEGNNLDNDALQGLLDLLLPERSVPPRDDSWAIIVISKSGGTLETAAAFRVLLRELERACGGDRQKLAERVIPVTGTQGRLFDLASQLGCPDMFPIPEGVGGRFSIFSAVGLLPAAVLGLDVKTLLEGAAAMNTRFRTAQADDNPPAYYTAVCHLLEKNRGANIRVLSTWGRGLESVGLWYDQLLSESLGKQERGATPITVVNTRDLHSRGQQHQEGRRDKVITNVIVEQSRREPVRLGHAERNEDQLNDLADREYPELLQAAIAGTNQAYREDRRPTADLFLPRLDEASLGQLFQMLMLATVLEGRLMGINPYGQPGVEAYKKHMQAHLRADAGK